jgi:uncharacterized membrane protein YeiB
LIFAAIWPADILHYIGVYFAIASMLLFVPTRWLAAFSGLATFGFVVLAIALEYESGWDFTTLTYSGFWHPVGFLRNLVFNGFHPILPWLSFLFVGMAIGRLNLNDPSTRRRALYAAMSAAVLSEAASWCLSRPLGNAWGLSDDTRILFGRGIMPPMPFFVLTAGAASAAVILFCQELAARFPNVACLRPFISTGQLSMTIYVAHVVAGMGLLEAAGCLEHQSAGFAAAASCTCCVLAVACSALWRARYPRGPLEWLMRRICG